jgi:hypothetical protein
LFGKVVVFGVGLIGGSFALALKAAGQVGEVVGFGRTLGSLTQALELGILDRAGFNVGQEVSNADLVLIATPVGTTAEIMARIAPCLGPQTVVTDAGSTKEDVVAAARACTLATGSGSSFRRIRSPAPKTVVHSLRGRSLSPEAGGADALAGKQSAATWPAYVRPGSAAAALIRELTPAEHDRFSPRSAICRTCCRLPWCMNWRGATTAISCSALRPAVSATSRASPPATRRCGATSAWPTGGLARRTRPLPRAARRVARCPATGRRCQPGSDLRCCQDGPPRVGREQRQDVSVDFIDLPQLLAARGTVRCRVRRASPIGCLLLAALASGETELRDLLQSDDTARMLDALRTLGVKVEALADRRFLHQRRRWRFPGSRG